MLRVLVVGDSCIDRYTYGTVNRVAPDKPVPILEIAETISSPGMASNLNRNLLHFGIKAELLTNSNFNTYVKERFVDLKTNHLFLRVDHGPIPEPLENLPDVSIYDIVVISDYDKGFLSETQIFNMCKAAKISFLDTKKLLGPWAESATYVKINEPEYNQSSGYLESQNKLNLIVTRGSKGASYRGIDYPTQPKEVIDVSGAGDTFLAGLVFAFSMNGSIETSIRLANEAANSVVSKRGVSLPELSELHMD